MSFKIPEGVDPNAVKDEMKLREEVIANLSRIQSQLQKSRQRIKALAKGPKSLRTAVRRLKAKKEYLENEIKGAPRKTNNGRASATDQRQNGFHGSQKQFNQGHVKDFFDKQRNTNKAEVPNLPTSEAPDESTRITYLERGADFDSWIKCLKGLKPGDQLEITAEDGETITGQFNSFRSYKDDRVAKINLMDTRMGYITDKISLRVIDGKSDYKKPDTESDEITSLTEEQCGDLNLWRQCLNQLDARLERGEKVWVEIKINGIRTKSKLTSVADYTSYFMLFLTDAEGRNRNIDSAHITSFRVLKDKDDEGGAEIDDGWEILEKGHITNETWLKKLTPLKGKLIKIKGKDQNAFVLFRLNDFFDRENYIEINATAPNDPRNQIEVFYSDEISAKIPKQAPETRKQSTPPKGPAYWFSTIN
ncbi:hypothetical protein A2335_01060 [Candidatus Peregrinibacteria bacterium RIFOXYB2_FULL_32_7]|nr:MAG: hypothetical protein A2335_01060 [Candidatus Peregrinibacteria bacterium RIFOXYB2_FULL_32_7]